MKYCVDLELAKKMYDKGLKIDSLFNYVKWLEHPWTLVLGKPENKQQLKVDIIPAPIAEELMEILPEDIYEGYNNYDLTVTKYNNYYEATYEELVEDYGREVRYECEDKKLSNTLSRLVLKLINEEILEVNK